MGGVKQLNSEVRASGSVHCPAILGLVQKTARVKNDHLAKVCSRRIEAGFEQQVAIRGGMRV
jgi:hypothetical protein